MTVCPSTKVCPLWETCISDAFKSTILPLRGHTQQGWERQSAGQRSRHICRWNWIPSQVCKWKNQSDRIVDNRFAVTSRLSVCPHLGISGTVQLLTSLWQASCRYTAVPPQPIFPLHFQYAPWIALLPITLSAELSKMSDLLLIK